MLALLAFLCCVPVSRCFQQELGGIPDRLADAEYWKLIQDFSEPDGYFRSDNLVSNEAGFLQLLPMLIQRTDSGGAYIGVGPEQTSHT